MDLGIKGRHALVTAAAGGLGKAVVEMLVAEGARVTAWDIDGAKLAELRTALPEVRTTELDLLDAQAVDTAVARMRSDAGDPAILVNITGGPPAGSIIGVGRDAWRHHFEQLMLSVITLTDRLLPAMTKNGWGRIITSVSSGVVAPIPDLGISNTLRSGLVGWSKTLAAEVALFGVTVNLVVPGRIGTPRIAQLDATRAQRRGIDAAAVARESEQSIPMKRYGRPVEFAAAVGFLASACASYITGSSLRVDGGLISNV